MICPACKGTGELMVGRGDFYGGTCEHCGGTGKTDTPLLPDCLCWHCRQWRADKAARDRDKEQRPIKGWPNLPDFNESVEIEEVQKP